MKDEVRQMNV